MRNQTEILKSSMLGKYVFKKQIERKISIKLYELITNRAIQEMYRKAKGKCNKEKYRKRLWALHENIGKVYENIVNIQENDQQEVPVTVQAQWPRHKPRCGTADKMFMNFLISVL